MVTRPEPRRHGWYPSSRGRANASAPLPASARAARATPSCDRTWWRWRVGRAASVRRAGKVRRAASLPAITARRCRGAGATRPPQRAGPAILGGVGAIDAGAPALLALERCSGKRMGSSAMSWRHVATEDLPTCTRRRDDGEQLGYVMHMRAVRTPTPTQPRSTCCFAWACARATRQPGALSKAVVGTEEGTPLLMHRTGSALERARPRPPRDLLG